jgi:hypothetical protein
MKSVAQDSSVELQKLAQSFAPIFAHVDDMNFFAQVRDQRVDNQAEIQNYTVGYIRLNPPPVGQQPLHREDPTDRLRTLAAEDLIPSEANLFIYGENCWTSISGVLHTYCGLHLERQGTRPRTYSPMYKLSKKPTKIFTLPARANGSTHRPCDP